MRTKYEATHYNPQSPQMSTQPDSAIAPFAAPQLDIIGIIQDIVMPSLRSPQTRRMYAIHLSQLCEFMIENRLPFNRTTVQSFVASKRESGLAAASINQALAAVKKLAYEARYSPSQAIPEEVYRGIQDIPAEKKQGTKTGKWLTIDQVTHLLHSIPLDLTGRRDRAILAVMIGCGLRREELLHLTPHQIQQREGRWVFVDVLGKGSKYRTVPIPAGVKARLDEWLEQSGLQPMDGLKGKPPVDAEFEPFLFVPIRRGGLVTEDERPLSESALSYIVTTRCEKAGLGKVAPHDLRRTFARIARKNRQDLDQIQAVLGHENVKTTQDYTGGVQNLQQTPGDSFDTDWGQK